MKISIVIPVFNENESLPDLKVELAKNLSAYSEWEVIFIDDGSSDGSTDYLADLCAPVSYTHLTLPTKA